MKAKQLKKTSYYTIHSKLTQKAVQAMDERNVQVYTAEQTDSQQWKFVPNEAGDAYQIVSKATGKALDIMLSATTSGAWLHQWEPSNAPSQWWIVEAAGENEVKIKSQMSGKCVDVVGISAEDGAQLQIWEDLDGDNQKWVLSEVAVKKAKAPAAHKEIVLEPEKKLTEPQKAETTLAQKPAARKPRQKKETAAAADTAKQTTKPAVKAVEKTAAKTAQKPAAGKAAPKKSAGKATSAEAKK